MDIITLDFETYYDQDYTLKKLTHEEYVRDSRFEIIGVAVKVNNSESVWLSGPLDKLQQYLSENYDWGNSAVLAHNTMFDGAIMSWILDIHPKIWLDTLCMARALHGVEVGGSLAYLAEEYALGDKGTEVVDAKGKRKKDFTKEELSAYGDYCVNDVELTHKLFRIFAGVFPKEELKTIDITLRMFIEPILKLDIPRLEERLKIVREDKEQLLATSGMEKKDLMSNPKFAKALEELGVVPPTKISLRTEKETFAFAKTDEGFKALQEHPDVQVQMLVAARIGLKSTLEETRIESFIEIGKRGSLPVPIKYYAAHTGRWGGMDSINLQNLPSRGKNTKTLKSCMLAPEGYTIIDADLSQIEARILAWFSEQDDLVRAFANREDVYVKMAAEIYDKAEEDISDGERFIGKQAILGAGYGMGYDRFKKQLAIEGVLIEEDEAKRIIKVYRDSNTRITGLWREAQTAIQGMYQGDKYMVGKEGILKVIPDQNAIKMPSGLLMRYTNLRAEQTDKGVQYSYHTRKGRVKIYGGKCVENICQALAKCVIAEQMVRVRKLTPPRLTVHDSIILCVPVQECLRWAPSWADGLPLDCDIKYGKNHGELEEWQ